MFKFRMKYDTLVVVCFNRKQCNSVVKAVKEEDLDVAIKENRLDDGTYRVDFIYPRYKDSAMEDWIVDSINLANVGQLKACFTC